MNRSFDNIIFDLGGVVLDIDLQLTRNAFRDIGFDRIDELFDNGNVKAFFRDYELGKISDTQFISDIKKEVGSHLADESIVAAWNALVMGFPPERIALLQELGKRYRIFLFSNTNAMHIHMFTDMFKKEFGGSSLEDLFEKVYYSNIMGMRKPDVMSYRHIIAENNLDPSGTLFIDDSKANIDGAVAAGLQAFHLERGLTILDIGL